MFDFQTWRAAPLTWIAIAVATILLAGFATDYSGAAELPSAQQHVWCPAEPIGRLLAQR